MIVSEEKPTARRQVGTIEENAEEETLSNGGKRVTNKEEE